MRADKSLPSLKATFAFMCKMHTCSKQQIAWGFWWYRCCLRSCSMFVYLLLKWNEFQMVLSDVQTAVSVEFFCLKKVWCLINHCQLWLFKPLKPNCAAYISAETSHLFWSLDNCIILINQEMPVEKLIVFTRQKNDMHHN